MSVIVGVKKTGRVAIAADTQSSQGNLRIPGKIKISPLKIHRIGRCYLGMVGSMAHHRVIASLYRRVPKLFDLSNAESIFETLRVIQKPLTEEYFTRTDEDETDQEYDSNQIFGIVISPEGLFSIQSYREVTEFKNFWAVGTGSEIAIGALEVAHSSTKSAKSIAETAVNAACQYDLYCGLPLVSYSMALK